MSGLSAAASWWEEWQMRLLVLTSLALQYVMWFIAGKRKFSTPSWFRSIVQVLFVANDALVLFALATLFNRQKNSSAACGRSHDRLEVLWAPILLMQIGGHAVSTVSSIEKDGKWKRIMLTLVSKVVVVYYVFYKSFSSYNDKELSKAASSLFAAIPNLGLLKIWNLKRTVDDYYTHDHTPTVDLASFVRRAASAEVEYASPAVAKVEYASPMVTAGRTRRVVDPTSKLCPDLPVIPDGDRLPALAAFLRVDDREAYRLIEDGLSTLFSIFYVKDHEVAKAKSWTTWFRYLIINWLLIQPIAYFHLSHKEAHRGSDIMVTFVLLYGALLLNNSPLFTLASFKWRWQWPTKVAQRSLLGFFIHSTRHTILLAIARFFGLKDFLDQHWGLQASCNSCFEITTLVRQHVKDGWLHRIRDVETYQRFTDTTGEWVLQQEGCDQLLEWTSQYPLDESVLVWHLATDLCFYDGESSPDLDCTRQRSREISNYMVYLLFANPEMLCLGSRASLFTDACGELERLIGRDHSSSNIRDLVRCIEPGSWEKSHFTVIRDAWKLAKALRDLNDGRKMWRVIQGVWVEMLCFSATRCRRYLHIKSLGSGGECLSYVWLLLQYAGMETLEDKLQKRYQYHQPVSSSPEHELASNV